MPAATPLTEPILNTPWDPPTRFWELDPRTNQATDTLGDGRRESTGRTMMPRSRKAEVQPELYDAAGQLFKRINRLREIVGAWRNRGYPGATAHTRQLLEFWDSDQPTMRPFFCQREAIETVIWLCEAGQIHDPNTWGGIDGEIARTNGEWNDDIARMALKMATGSGKTVVMAMLMIWHAVNKSRPRDFLIIAPNLTVKDRLAELRSDHSEWLLPQLTPLQFQPDLNRLRVTILNFQAFQRRDMLHINGVGDKAPKAVRQLLRKGADPRWEETDDEMLHRLLANHRSAKSIVVINDEAHHCYRMVGRTIGKASKDEKAEEGKAALWFSALKALQAQERLAQVFDLSATPMYLRRPAELQSEHFPWVVSDYPLSDAIEAGLTKIPRLPVDDDSAQDDPVYRNLYEHTKPKMLDGANMQQTVRDALDTMHRHYDESVAPEYGKHGVIPVMIAVANNIANATALFRWIAGYRDEQGRFHRGQLEAFSNVRPDGSGYVDQPPTLLVHSQLGDTEDGGGSALNRIANAQAELHAPSGATKKEQVQAIRNIFNSVGRRGEPGQHIRCVISVGMLTEGWDAKTVTHIFGFRAFSSQLLCEQVTGRALRRTSFEPDPETGEPRPEYANVFGVPYEFMRGVEMAPTPAPPKEPYEVAPVPGREHLRIVFPNLCGYAWSTPDPTVTLNPDWVASYDIDPPALPTETTVAGTVGVADTQSPSHERTRQMIVWSTAAEAVRQFETSETRRRALFASMLKATEAWLRHPKVAWPDERIEWLLMSPHSEEAPDAIAKVTTLSDTAAPRLMPVYADQRDPMQPRERSTDITPFMTTLEPVWETTKSELNRAPCHSSFEHAVAQKLDVYWMIEAWARNFRLGWTIPWRDRERDIWANYEPDFVARVTTEDDQPDLHLIIECKGKPYDDASANAKRIAVESQWIPAVEATGDYGRWRYVYLTEDSDFGAAISAAIAGADHG